MSNNPTKEKSSRWSAPDPKSAKSPVKVDTPETLIEQHSRTETKSSPEQRHERIAVVAFRLAESRGFAPGGELEDWLRAESEIDGQGAR